MLQTDSGPTEETDDLSFGSYGRTAFPLPFDPEGEIGEPLGSSSPRTTTPPGHISTTTAAVAATRDPSTAVDANVAPREHPAASASLLQEVGGSSSSVPSFSESVLSPTYATVPDFTGCAPVLGLMNDIQCAGVATPTYGTGNSRSKPPRLSAFQLRSPPRSSQCLDTG